METKTEAKGVRQAPGAPTRGQACSAELSEALEFKNCSQLWARWTCECPPWPGPRFRGRGLGEERGLQGPSLNRRSTPRSSPNPPSTWVCSSCKAVCVLS